MAVQWLEEGAPFGINDFGHVYAAWDAQVKTGLFNGLLSDELHRMLFHKVKQGH